MRTKYTILVDSREKKPLPLPASLSMRHPSTGNPITVQVETEKRTLEAADYLVGLEPASAYTTEAQPSVIIERKYTLDELATNLFNRRRRESFIRCLNRMKAYPHPLLLLEGNLPNLYSKWRGKGEPGHVIDELQRVLFERSIPYMLYPASTIAQRRGLGELVARHLINAELCL